MGVRRIPCQRLRAVRHHPNPTSVRRMSVGRRASPRRGTLDRCSKRAGPEVPGSAPCARLWRRSLCQQSDSRRVASPEEPALAPWGSSRGAREVLPVGSLPLPPLMTCTDSAIVDTREARDPPSQHTSLPRKRAPPAPRVPSLHSQTRSWAARHKPGPPKSSDQSEQDHVRRARARTRGRSTGSPITVTQRFAWAAGPGRVIVLAVRASRSPSRSQARGRRALGRGGCPGFVPVAATGRRRGSTPHRGACPGSPARHSADRRSRE